MGKVFIRGTTRGIKFYPAFHKQSAEIRTALLRGKTVELEEGALTGLVNSSYEIVNKTQVEDSPSAPPDEEPINPPEEDFEEVSELDAESSNEEDIKEAASYPKSKNKKRKNY